MTGVFSGSEIETDVYERAVTRFGRKNQTIVAIEELSELQKALTKIMRGGDDYDSVAEEIADSCANRKFERKRSRRSYALKKGCRGGG